ncbi:hypothetical protein B0H14DRAFT_2583639 [Mycena olivaceomarginata]|nr:hypothetical protein B0H14DRAFT_2583639 [Mycena olivaceomarginata]
MQPTCDRNRDLASSFESRHNSTALIRKARNTVASFVDGMHPGCMEFVLGPTSSISPMGIISKASVYSVAGCHEWRTWERSYSWECGMQRYHLDDLNTAAELVFVAWDNDVSVVNMKDTLSCQHSDWYHSMVNWSTAWLSSIAVHILVTVAGARVVCESPRLSSFHAVARIHGIMIHDTASSVIERSWADTLRDAGPTYLTFYSSARPKCNAHIAGPGVGAGFKSN